MFVPYAVDASEVSVEAWPTGERGQNEPTREKQLTAYPGRRLEDYFRATPPPPFSAHSFCLYK